MLFSPANLHSTDEKLKPAPQTDEQVYIATQQQLAKLRSDAEPKDFFGIIERDIIEETQLIPTLIASIRAKIIIVSYNHPLRNFWQAISELCDWLDHEAQKKNSYLPPQFEAIATATSLFIDQFSQALTIDSKLKAIQLFQDKTNFATSFWQRFTGEHLVKAVILTGCLVLLAVCIAGLLASAGALSLAIIPSILMSAIQFTELGIGTYLGLSLGGIAGIYASNHLGWFNTQERELIVHVRDTAVDASQLNASQLGYCQKFKLKFY